MTRAAPSRKRTRIQNEKRQIIFDAALEVFAEKGLRGATLDQIADAAGISKQNIVYYFSGKEAIYSELLGSLLAEWLRPLRELSAEGDPIEEILTYVRRKLTMSRELPLQSRLFATEILQGAPRLGLTLGADLKGLVDEKAAIIQGWIADGKIAPLDPHHLIFSIWATTQHYADFDIQVRSVLGEARGDGRFDEAESFLSQLYIRSLRP